jgi:hypothetical protein
MNKPTGLRCPHCKKNVDFGKQMMEWDKDYGDAINIDDPENSWAWIAVYCHHCDQYAFSVDLTGCFTEEEPAPENLKKDIPDAKTIAFPTTKKPKN